MKLRIGKRLYDTDDPRSPRTVGAQQPSPPPKDGNAPAGTSGAQGGK